jgi:N6-adenosine-specific RNA methylase IME4/transposase-like protein
VSLEVIGPAPQGDRPGNQAAAKPLDASSLPLAARENVTALSRDAAERLTTRISLKLGTLADAYESVMPLIREAIDGKAHEVLGYPSIGAYAADRFGDSLTRLGVDMRRDVVGELLSAGMSIRAIAPIVGASKSTVANDIAQLSNSGQLIPPETITGMDGRQRSAFLRLAKEIQRKEREERLAVKAERVAAIAAATPSPLHSLGPFPVILADPPWRYEFIESASRAIENHYPTMSLDEICDLEVPAADDCVLFLWVTPPKVAEGIQVLDAWGFNFRTSMVWVKDKIGMGKYVRQQHEWLMIAKRGNFPLPDPEDRPASVIEAPRGAHSEKPEEIHKIIERMYPFLDRCELFARKPRDGWASWGNEIGAVA